MPSRLTYLSSQPAKQESLEEWVLRCSPNSSYLHKNLPQPDCCYFLGDNRDSTSSLFKFRGMKLMSIPKPLSVQHTGGFFTRASQKAKNFLFSQVQAASTTHSINSRPGPGILHTRRGLLAVPPIFSTILDWHSIFLCTISHDHCQNPINRGTNFLVGSNSSLSYTLAEDFNSSIFSQLPFFPKMLQTLTKQERKT